MDIGSLQRQIKDGQKNLADASDRSATASEQLIGVARQVEESLNVTWQLLQENEAQHRALMGEYRQLVDLLASVSSALGEGQPVNGGQRMDESEGDEGRIDLEAFQAAFNEARDRGQNSNGHDEPA